MDLHHLRIFTTVYGCGSFTGASKKLAISQPTISEHIKNLETELCLTLFDRLGRSIKPTDAARSLFPRALKIIDDLDSLKNDLQQQGDPLAGELTIGASTIPGEYILPGIAAKFKRKNELVRFNVEVHDSADICRMVAGHEVIIGIVGARSQDKHLNFRAVFNDELLLVAPATTGYPDQITIADLRDLPFICREEGSGTQKSVARILAAHGVEVERLTKTATLGSSTAAKEAVKAGLGVAIISSLAIRDELDSRRMKKITVKGLEMKRRFFLVTHRKRTLPHLYQAFITSIKHDLKP